MKITEKIKRKIYCYKAANMAAEQFKLTELPDVVAWLNTHMKYCWTYFEEPAGKTYWKDLGDGTSTETSDCLRFYFIWKKDAALFRLRWG